MDRARLHEGIRRMRFTDILGRSERSELSQMEAAELLGISERTFRRWRDRHRETGLAGLDDRRLAPSPRRWPRSNGCWAYIASFIAASRSSTSTNNWASGTTTRWAIRSPR